MTVATGGSEGSVEVYTGGYAGIGLQDVSASDMAMPRLKIIGTEAVFEDSLTNEKFAEFDAVVLALVKGRIMWFEKQHDNAIPQCKSNNFTDGFPTLKAQDDRDVFPWAVSNYTPEQMEINPENDLPSLSCAKCNMKEWPKTKGETPSCSEQHTYPLLRIGEDGTSTPGILTVSGSSIKPSKAFATAANIKREPFFFYKTRISLIPATRGSVHYAIAKFTKMEKLDPSEYDEYADQARSLYSYLTQPPRNRNADDNDPAAEATEMSANENVPVVESAPTPVAAPPTPPVVPPVVVAAPVASGEVLPPVAKRSDLPF